MIQVACFWCNHVWTPRKDKINVCPNPECHSRHWATIIIPKQKNPMADPETRAKVSKAMKGRPHSAEHNAKVSAALLRPENRARARAARLGYKVSPATRLKLSYLKMGNQNVKGRHLSESHRNAIRDKLIGIKRSDKTKALISAGGIGKHSLENNPAWKGGVAYAPYCPKFNFAFKERVREFFGRRCVVCGKHEDELGKHMDVHHVESDKQTCCNDTKPLFVILCRGCHSKVRHNDEHYAKLFLDIIQSKFGGRCYN